MLRSQPPKPVHIPGTNRGEELVRTLGREPGRDRKARVYRTARDATGIDADARRPIDPRSPEMPPP
jgi:hypothetical protein